MEKSPYWPLTNATLEKFIDSHNDKIIESGLGGYINLDASKSITLIMACSGLKKEVPSKFHLNFRGKGISDHITYVSDYLKSVQNESFFSQKAQRVEKQVRFLSSEWGISIEEINSGLEDAMMLS